MLGGRSTRDRFSAQQLLTRIERLFTIGRVTAPRDQRAYNLAYYRRNREAEIERVASRQRATLEMLRTVRRQPCNDCGETFAPYVMQFDRRDPSTKKFWLTSSR